MHCWRIGFLIAAIHELPFYNVGSIVYDMVITENKKKKKQKKQKKKNKDNIVIHARFFQSWSSSEL